MRSLLGTEPYTTVGTKEEIVLEIWDCKCENCGDNFEFKIPQRCPEEDRKWKKTCGAEKCRIIVSAQTWRSNRDAKGLVSSVELEYAYTTWITAQAHYIKLKKEADLLGGEANRLV